MASLGIRNGSLDSVFQIRRRVHYNSWISSKPVLAVLIAYVILIIALPIRRTWLPESVTLLNQMRIVDNLARAIPLPFLFMLVFADALPKSAYTKVVNWLTSPRLTVPASYLIMSLCLGLALFNVPMFWENYTWLSVGICAGCVTATQVVIRDRLSNLAKFTVGVALLAICISTWESPYQLGQYFLYFLPQHSLNMPKGMLAFEMLKHSTPAIAGISTLAYISFIHKLKFNISQWFYMALAIVLAMYFIWFITGFYLDVTYDWATFKWTLQPVPDWFSMVLSKGSKAIYLLCPALLFLGKEKSCGK